MGAEIERGPTHRLTRNTMVVDDPPLSHDRAGGVLHTITVHENIDLL